MLLRVEAAIAQLKAELDPSQLAEILQPPSQARTDGYGTSDNPLVIDALPTSQTPVTSSTPSTTAGPASTVTAPTSNPAADFSLQDQMSFSAQKARLGPSYAEKYAGNRDEGQKRIAPEPGTFMDLGWDPLDATPIKPRQNPTGEQFKGKRRHENEYNISVYFKYNQ